MARITKAPEERRQEIVETAERLFREVGYGKCSVEMIIREIGVAKGTFYYYFKSKEEILGAIVERTIAGLEEMAQAIADDPDRDALAKLALLLLSVWAPSPARVRSPDSNPCRMLSIHSSLADT